MFGNVITTTGNKWTIGSLNPSGNNDYSAVIEALQTQGDTKILSAPRLAVVNNESAKILVGSKQVYVTTTAVQGQSTTETAEAVNFVDVGVQLYVTPTIGVDGYISIKVRPEVSAVTENYTTSTGNKIPIVETSETETTVLLEDGATLVIGGLMKDETIKTANKIPWIGNIPFFGFFFRNTVSETRKTELVIFLTCRVMDFSGAGAPQNLGLQKS
jgi:general secretion pathway protein D